VLTGRFELALFMDAKLGSVESPSEMKTRTHFAHRIDMLDAPGEIQEHLAGVEDYTCRRVSVRTRGNRC